MSLVNFLFIGAEIEVWGVWWGFKFLGFFSGCSRFVFYFVFMFIVVFIF